MILRWVILALINNVYCQWCKVRQKVEVCSLTMCAESGPVGTLVEGSEAPEGCLRNIVGARRADSALSPKVDSFMVSPLRKYGERFGHFHMNIGKDLFQGKAVLLMVFLLITITQQGLICDPVILSSERCTNGFMQSAPLFSVRSTGPDMEISSSNISVTPDPIRVGDTCFLTAEIHNIGDEPAYFVNISFTVNGESLGSPIALTHLGDGASDNVTKIWQPQEPGNHTIGVVVDPGGDIEETDENNNAASLVVPVYARGNVQPSVNITHPADMETVRGTVIISGSAHDNPGDENELVRVEVRIDGGDWNEANGLQAWQYGWDTTGLSEGLHTLSARSYDGEDHSAVDSIRAVVDNDPTNQPPIALISNPRTNDNFSVNETVFFQGNESRDPDDGPLPLNHTWELGDGTVLYGANINYSYFARSPMIVITLSLYDGDRESSDTVQIRVDNTPPVAVAGPDRSAELGECIIFNGSGSYDPDAPIDGMDLSDYRWDMGNGDVLTGPVVNYTYEEGGGSYEVILTVMDGKGASDNDSLVVTLNNTLPVAALGIPSRTACVGADIHFSAVDSYDPDGGEVVEYYFDLGDGHSTGWLSRPGADHIYSATGEYHPRLKVKDSQGGTSLWNSGDITVIPLPNEAPGIVITSPLPDAVVTSPLTVLGTCDDPDAQDEIEMVEVEFEGILVLGEPRGGTSLREWKAAFNDIGGIPNGPAEIRARVFDGKEWSGYVTLPVHVNNDPPRSMAIALSIPETGFFSGETVVGSGSVTFDTGVAVGGAAVACDLDGSNRTGVTDDNGHFSFSLTAPEVHGQRTLIVAAERGNMSATATGTVLVYRVDLMVDRDSVELYRGDEKIIGYNDAVTAGETVELRFCISFFCDAAEGPLFPGRVNVTDTLGTGEKKLMKNRSVKFRPDGGLQKEILSIDWTPEAGTHTIGVEVSADNDSVPGNNSILTKFTVKGETFQPDFMVESIEVSSDRVREGNVVTVSVTVLNSGNSAGLVNVSIYEDDISEADLVDRKSSILLKPETGQTIPFNWRPDRGHVNLVVVVDSSLDEPDKDNNEKMLAVKVYPPENQTGGGSYLLLTILLIGGIFLAAAVAWVYLRRKEEEEEETAEAGDAERVEFGTVMGETDEE